MDSEINTAELCAGIITETRFTGSILPFLAFYMAGKVLMFTFKKLVFSEVFKIIIGDLHTLLTRDFWLPSQDFSGTCNVWLALQRIIGREGFVNNFLRSICEFNDLLGKFLDRDLIGITNIYRIAVIA